MLLNKVVDLFPSRHHVALVKGIVKKVTRQSAHWMVDAHSSLGLLGIIVFKTGETDTHVDIFP